MGTPEGVELVVPEGALPADTTITVTPVAGGPSGAVGPVYALEPEGLTFAAPVSLTLPYDPSKTSGEDLAVASDRGGAWSGQGWALVDRGSYTATTARGLERARRGAGGLTRWRAL